MKTFHILSLAGFGDTLSAITRLPSVKEKYPDYRIVFYIGGFGKSVNFSREQLNREGYEVNVIKNLTYHNQLPEIRKLIKDNFLSDGDIFEDWSFCEEIFQNKKPPFYKYPMKFPYEYKSPPISTKRNSEKQIIAIHPLTKSGNAEGFDSDMAKGRFWNRDEWKVLCINLLGAGYEVAFVGHGDEDWGLIEELNSEGYEVLDKRMGVPETISFLKTVDGGIFCNSWDWEITSRMGIPTICFYTKNHFFIQNHIPEGPSSFWDNCYIEVRPNFIFMNYKSPIDMHIVKSKSIFEKFNFMMHEKRRPNFPYDVCMITYNDEEYIHDTLENVAPYIRNKFCVVDGGSQDNTVDIIKNSISHKQLNFKEIFWDNKFDVQKNNAIEMAEQDWVIFIDADETYEDLFWNQIDWYMAEAMQNKMQCINVSRINTYNDATPQQLKDFVDKLGWQMNGFGWVNYPDFQQRIFEKEMRFEGHVHETIKDFKCQMFLFPVNCIHKKTLAKQMKSFELYKNIEEGNKNGQ